MGVLPPPEGLEPEPQKARRLNRMGDIRGALADVARMLETSRMEPERARALINCLDTLGKYIKERDLEAMAERIREIQARKAEQAKAATSPPALAVVPPAVSAIAPGT